MKKSLLLASLVCCSAALVAQPNQANIPSDQPSRSSNQSTDASLSGGASAASTNSQGSQIISEPSGAQSPSAAARDNDSPNGRAFSTNNPPNGRPFQENPGLPPGHRKNDLKEGEQGGIPTQEPAGAQRTNQSSSTSTNSSSVSGADVISSPQSGRSSTASSQSQGVLKPGDPGYGAGAQRHESTQLQNELAQIKTSSTVSTEQKTQLQQTLTSMVTSSQTLPPEFITRLSDDLTTSLSKVEIKEEMRTRLANDIAVILGAQPSAQTEIQQAFTDVQTILLMGPNTTPMARATVCDLHLIASQLTPGVELHFTH